MPASWSSLMARTNFRTVAGSRARSLAETIAPRKLPPTPRLGIRARLRPPSLRAASREVPGDEPVAAVYSAAGCHHTPHGGSHSGGLGRLPAIAGLGSAASRLPHHSSANVLSRRQPRGHGFFGDRAARTPEIGRAHV